MTNDFINHTDEMMSSPDGSDGKKSACNSGDLSLIPGSRISPREEKWQPTPIFLSEEFHGQRSLVGYSPWSCTELYMTEQLIHPLMKQIFTFSGKTREV